jgi:mono/diheme cytochrome c family protein
MFHSAVLAAVLAGAALGLSRSALGQGGGNTDTGLHVYKAANCVGCHKWSGVGGGGYGGAALSLRDTQLDREHIVKTIHCGRPGAGMPYFERDAYETGACDGLKKAEMPSGMMPPEPDHYLRPQEIEAVADYVLGKIKGHGLPTFTECQAFFGTTSHVCDTYKEPSAAPGEKSGGG